MSTNKKMISFEIQDNLREALRRKAYVENVSISKLIREILEASLINEIQTIEMESINGKYKD